MAADNANPVDEDVLAAAFERGELVAAGGAEISATAIARVLGRADPASSWPRPALRLTGARITGRLDLSFMEVGHPLLLEDCDFEQAPLFYWSRLAFTSFRGSRMPGLIGANVAVAGHLRLFRCRFAGQVDLKGAKLQGGLLLSGAEIIRPGAAALQADRAEIGGDLVAEDGFRMTGSIRLFQATVGGLHLDGAVIDGTGAGAGHQAIEADNAVLRGGMFARGAQIRGEISLRHASIGGAFSLRGAEVSNPGKVALRMDRADIRGGVFLHGGARLAGEVRMVSTQIGRTVRIVSGSIHNPGGYALLADAVTIDGSLDCRGGFTAHGEISLREARVAGPIRFEGAQLENPDGTALSASGIVAGSIIKCCAGFTATGRISVSSAKVASRLCFDDSHLRASPVALRCSRTSVGELSLRLASAPAGLVDLSHTHVGILRDNPETWPAALVVDGLTYQTLEPALPSARRLDWLSRAPDILPPQPYEQLAANYRQVGDDTQARAVLLARQRRQRSTRSRPARIWSWLQDITVGYGYRPQRAALWLAALLLLGTVSFGIHHPAPVGAGPAPQFNPVFYTLDLLLPVVNFGQEPAYDPRGGQQWLAYFLIAAGWTLATTVAAGFTRATSRI